MNKLFTEFGNENALRSYPFASGCTAKDTKGAQIGTGTLVDAVLYPVNPVGTVYLSKITVDGVVNISDSEKVIMTATMQRGSDVLEFYDTSPFKRHVGTLVASSADALSILVNTYTDRIFRASETAFAASCVFPVVNDGVLSIDVNKLGALDGDVTFANSDSDIVRVSTNANGDKLRFDIIPQQHLSQLSSIQHIYCIVDGKTPFRIQKLAPNTVILYLDNIDRQDICGEAHREDAIETRDTCDCEGSSSPCTPDIDPPVDIPDVYQVEVVDIPHDTDSAFYLAVPNMFGYDNPISITMKDGVVVPKQDIEISSDAGVNNLDALTDSITSKGIVIQVPGLAPTT